MSHSSLLENTWLRQDSKARDQVYQVRLKKYFYPTNTTLPRQTSSSLWAAWSGTIFLVKELFLQE